MTAPTCPYCNSAAELVSGSVIYPHRPDLADRRFWRCKPCNAWVGCHQGSKDIPLGRLADAQLRRAKMGAHAAFDPIWKMIMQQQGCNKGVARWKAYAWLATQLAIPAENCHIGMFDAELCQRVVDICNGVEV